MATSRVSELEKKEREQVRLLQSEIAASSAAKNRVMQLEPLANELTSLRPRLEATAAELGRTQARVAELTAQLRQADGERHALAQEVELLQPLVSETEQLRANVAALSGQLQAASAEASEASSARQQAAESVQERQKAYAEVERTNRMLANLEQRLHILEQDNLTLGHKLDEEKKR